MKRVYLSGPMTGLPELNFPAFRVEAARLRALGFEVVNPADLNPEPNTGWHCWTGGSSQPVRTWKCTSLTASAWRSSSPRSAVQLRDL